MTQDERSAVSAGCNLATLPADVLEDLERDRRVCLERYQAAARVAQVLWPMRKDRVRLDWKLKQQGDLEPLVREALNRMLRQQKRESTDGAR